MISIPGAFIAFGDPTKEALESMNRSTREWTMRAARGDCEWVCADCSCSFPDGMPSECEHGHARCTEIIQRDKSNCRGGA